MLELWCLWKCGCLFKSKIKEIDMCKIPKEGSQSFKEIPMRIGSIQKTVYPTELAYIVKYFQMPSNNCTNLIEGYH